MTRQEYLNYINQNQMYDILYQYYLEHIDKSKYKILSKGEFIQPILAINIGRMLDRAIYYFNNKLQVNILQYTDGKIIKFL